MKTKPITFLLALTFLFLFSGSSVVFADDYQDSKDAYERKDYETAYKLIAPLAEQGHAKAQFNLGGMYANGYGVPQDYKEAVKWYRLAADRGLEHAQFNLGRVYYYGQGVSKDSVLAHMWWSLASSNGGKDAIDSRKLVEKEMSPQQIEKAQQLARNWKPSDRIKIAKSPPFVSRSDFQDATDAYERNDYKEAYKIMLPLAKRGVAKGQYNLGLMYFKGKGVPQDYKEAVRWFRLSAEQEFGLAQYNLGFMYEKGHGVPQDYKEAVRLYRLSAEQGDAKGQYNLGLMYAEGKGVLQDSVLAHKWWSLASSNGDKDAIYNRKQVETKMSPSQIEKAQQLARNWKLKDRIKIEKSPPSVVADDLKDATDAHQRKDYKEAIRLFRLSAEKGNAKGQLDLGFMYANGHGVPQNYKEALRLFRLSAEQEFADAQHNVGWMYENGYGIPQDYKEAVKWYRLSAEQGNARAQYNLGLNYYNGQGVSKDYVLAHMWWSLAGSNGYKDAIDSRKLVEKEMSPSQIEKAQELARNWKPSDRIKIEKSPPSVVADYLQDGIDAYNRQDYKEAFRLYRLSAEQGHALGQFNLGLNYYNGQGVAQDYVLAHMWWNISGSNGNERASKYVKQVETKMSPSQIEKAQQLARNWKPSDRIKIAESPPSVVADDLKDATDAYERNDYKEAVRLFRLSAEKGNAVGQNNLGEIYALGHGVPQDYKEAVRWFRLAAEQGYAIAQYNLGLMCGKGHGVLQDYKEAIRLFRLSAEQGNAKGQSELGLMYYKGQGVPRDYKEAVKWIRLAAEQGYANAKSDLGFLYKEGHGVPQDYKEAVRLYRLAAEQEFGLAQNNLGEMYEKGHGVSQDYVLALMWWIIASYNGDQSAIHKRKILVKKMSPQQIEKAQQLARNWNTNKMRTAESPPSATPQPPKSKDGAIATGTGFLFGSRDYIVTNYHVVKGTSQVKVKFLNEEIFDAQVIAKDIQNDVAILKLNKTPSLQSIEMKFGDSSRVRMGDKVFTIGYPSTQILGTKPKYSEGVISAVTGIQDNPTMFQTTVPILPGSSGSPLFNENGEVIGLTTGSLSSIASDLMGSVQHNINYAIKSSFVKNIIGTVPDSLFSNRGIVVVPTDSNSRADFIEAISKNVVLILGKVD